MNGGFVPGGHRISLWGTSRFLGSAWLSGRAGTSGSFPPPSGASALEERLGLATSTECTGDCLEVDPVVACGNSATNPTNSVWPVGWPGLSGVGDWIPKLGGGCERVVECADYSASCGRTEWTNSTGACAGGDPPCTVGAWTGWVFTPNDAGGDCQSTWTCVGSSCGTNKGGGVFPDSGVQYGNDGGTDRSTRPAKQSCEGVQVQGGRRLAVPSHGVDSETTPDLSKLIPAEETDCWMDGVALREEIARGYCTAKGEAADGWTEYWCIPETRPDLVPNPNNCAGSIGNHFLLRRRGCSLTAQWCCTAYLCGPPV